MNSALEWSEELGRSRIPPSSSSSARYVFLVSRTQKEAFLEGYISLLTEKEIPNKSSLGGLCPEFDDHDVMQGQDRLELAECLLLMSGFPLYCQGVNA